MILSKNRHIRRLVDVVVTFDVPASLRALGKDVSLSFHSDDIAGDPRAQCAPWTDAVRMVGAEERFVVRMKVPGSAPFLLHAVAIIDEPGVPDDSVAVRRHLGFANLRVAADGASEIALRISHFESYTLVMPARPTSSGPP